MTPAKFSALCPLCWAAQELSDILRLRASPSADGNLTAHYLLGRCVGALSAIQGKNELCTEHKPRKERRS